MFSNVLEVFEIINGDISLPILRPSFLTPKASHFLDRYTEIHPHLNFNSSTWSLAWTDCCYLTITR